MLLKGSTTLVAHPGSPVAVNATGTPLLATAGSGDVLSGIIGALMASGLPATEAAVCGAHLHGRAAARAHGGAPISASDLLDAIPTALLDIREADPA